LDPEFARDLYDQLERMARHLERIADGLETTNKLLDTNAAAAAFREFGAYVSPLNPPPAPAEETPAPVPDYQAAGRYLGLDHQHRCPQCGDTWNHYFKACEYPQDLECGTCMGDPSDVC
jgi:hypothetical protein